ncbi:MAG: Crp/Fnr family transcriptional regulator [Cyanobacteria bacterium P01_H01_bin.58]
MYDSTHGRTTRDRSAVLTFKRRETMPLRENTLWRISKGAVRCFTTSEDGAVITLGFWGAGDLIGQPLACIQPCAIECLTRGEALLVKTSQCWDLDRVMLAHIGQMQELIRIRHGHIAQRLLLLLNWLASKFGVPTEQGNLIQLRLTHQDMAEAIGATRVTVTRMIQEFEHSAVISYSKQQCLILH